MQRRSVATWSRMCRPERPGKPCRPIRSAQLVDVRTDAEWNFVGLPDLAAAGKQAVLIPWQVYPTMQRNAAFEEHLREAGFTPGAPHLFPVPQRRAQPGRGRGGAGGRASRMSTTSPTGSRAAWTPTAIAASRRAGRRTAALAATLERSHREWKRPATPVIARRGAPKQSPPDEPRYARQAGDCFGAPRLAMAGGAPIPVTVKAL